jgi:glyoxylase-like metal-dependent hydrolase (beta-lactamase superfamily II)
MAYEILRSVTIVRVADFGFQVPEGDRMLQFEVSGFGVLASGRRIVIDPWLAFDGKRSEPDGPDRWGRISKELAAADLDPADVDTVVFTHLDGVGWALGPDNRTPGFPNARHLVTQTEIDALHAGERQGSEGADTLIDLGLLDALALGEIAPGVRAEHCPGHSSGGVVVNVTDDDGDAVFVGHLFLHPAQLQAVERAELEVDPELSIAARRAVLADAQARNAKLYGDLWEAPGWQYAPA